MITIIHYSVDYYRFGNGVNYVVRERVMGDKGNVLLW